MDTVLEQYKKSEKDVNDMKMNWEPGFNNRKIRNYIDFLKSRVSQLELFKDYYHIGNLNNPLNKPFNDKNGSPTATDYNQPIPERNQYLVLLPKGVDTIVLEKDAYQKSLDGNYYKYFKSAKFDIGDLAIDAFECPSGSYFWKGWKYVFNRSIIPSNFKTWVEEGESSTEERDFFLYMLQFDKKPTEGYYSKFFVEVPDINSYPMFMGSYKTAKRYSPKCHDCGNLSLLKTSRDVLLFDANNLLNIWIYRNDHRRQSLAPE
jgi:hypothetical protein